MATNKARLNFHHGETFFRLAQTYPTLAQTVLEMIQNALDAHAKHVYVRIDLKHSHATVLDDGDGISVDKFGEALSEIGHSQKPRKGTLGRFGLGLISPLNKARTFTVSSKSRGSDVATTWVFDPNAIKERTSNIDIPMKRSTDLPHINTPWNTMAKWRTVIQLKDLVKDRVITMIDLDDLEAKILTSFGTAMRENGTKCRVELMNLDGKVAERTISPREYSGQPLAEFTVEGDDVGTVHFRLFKARSRAGAQPQGKVSVRQADDMFMLGWPQFYNQARARRWGDIPAFKALNSGFFEGVITAKNVELEASRTKFVGNDALLDLYMQIGEWFENVGRAHMDDEAERTRSEKRQTLALRSLHRWNDLLDDPEYAALRAGLESTFVYGRMGDGHVDPSFGKPGETQDDFSIRTGQGGAGKPKVGEATDKSLRPGSGTSKDPNEERGPDRPGDLPLGAIGPRGQKRTLVKHDSLGLQLAHVSMDGTDLWELDVVKGILYFNISHRLWERCETKDAWVLHLQDWVIMQVLHLLIHPADMRDVLNEASLRQARCYIDQFICSSPPKRN